MGVEPADEIAAALTARAEVRRVRALQTLPGDQQARLGQFFTPERAADLIAGLPRLPRSGHLRVLDPGAGSGSLAAALTGRVLRECPDLNMDITAIEIDPDVAHYLKETLDDVAHAAANVGSEVKTKLVLGDYLDIGSGLLQSPTALQAPFDLVIMNPPYRKLALSSLHRKALASQGIDCPNLYAGFLALGALALKPGGQLIAITPRSFANGPYFGKFRKFLLDRVALDRLHVFESRSTVFSDTGVLQENIVLSGTRNGSTDKVVLSVSRGHTDDLVEREVSYTDVIRPGDGQRFIRVVAGDQDTAIAETMTSLPSELAELGLQVSTGRVVDFRSRKSLVQRPTAHSHPLIYPGNVCGGIVDWPRETRKDQGFAVRSTSDEKLLFPEGCYVVVKRFSAKEERRRVVAAVWDPAAQPGPIAFENHLNVFHSRGLGLDRDLAIGLSYWLNSSIVDSYFRTFSGHTQVNAADLRSMRFPSREQLRSLGHGRDLRLPQQETIDAHIMTLITLIDGAAA